MELSRRDFLKAASAVPIAASLPAFGHGGEAKTIGEWSDDEAGLPRYSYLGPVPVPLPSDNIPREYLPEDPFFLIGNYRFTLFAHVSGIYEILSGERAWGRMNQGPGMWSGANRASVTMGAETVPLIGSTERAAQTAEKNFGVGYAQYRYRPAAGLGVTRTLSVMPSSKPGDGTSAFVLSVALRNEGTAPLDVTYVESVKAAYKQAFSQWDADRDLLHASGSIVKDFAQVRCDFHVTEPRPLLFSRKGRMSRFEGAPPSLFVRVPAAHRAEVMPTAEKDAEGADWIGVRAAFTLAASHEKVFHCIVGYAYSQTEIDRIDQTLAGEIGAVRGPHFQNAWDRAIPKFADEPDGPLRREMRWNAGVLEQMTTWREYYDETVVPQGTVYDYQWGTVASNRDQAQHALPMCHTNPAIARSTLRYIMKRTVPDGEIKLDDLGFGWAPHSGRLTSDQQLYFFLLLNEYLRATGDASILTETISYYPLECAGTGSGLDHVRDAFLFLRDRIGTGSHGLAKLWNSDWNDMFFWWPTSQSYNYIFDTSESHMNTAMAIAILGDLADTLHKFGKAEESADLASAVAKYRTELLKAYLADWGSRPFPKRMYFQNEAVGQDEMWLEPQGFTLLIPEISPERKRALLAEMETRLIKGEPMGPKQIEKPVDKPGTRAGSRENGGFWYALTGPVILGVAGFDREAAFELLRKQTFGNYARQFPQYWTGQWSASDSLDSLALPTVGLSQNIVYCAHAHAWPLYCYLRLTKG
jgi:Glycosyl hydrolase 36 superfamily, catalytic domain